MSRRLLLLLLLALPLLVRGSLPAQAARASGTTGSISGSVRDGAGRPIYNAAVSIQSGFVFGEARTDRTGRYTLSDLPPGKYDLLAAKPAYTPLLKTQVAVTANTAAPANFVLSWANPDAGALEVVVTGPGGVPLPEATVQLSTGDAAVGQQTSDAAGSSVFPGLDPGAYLVTVQRAGFSPFTSRNLFVRQGALTSLSVQLRQDTSQVGRLTGTVRAADGSPLYQAVVKIVGGLSSGLTLTAGSGAYTLPGLIPGSNYALQVSAGGYATQTAGSLQVIAQQDTFRDFVLIRSPSTRGSITGVIKDSTGATLPFTTVAITAGPGQGRQATAGADGRYALTDLDPGDGYALRVEQTGYAPQGKAGIRVSAGQSTEVDFQLQSQTLPPGKIGGTVRDSVTGLALSGVTVTIIQGRSAGLATETDGAGVYLLEGLIPDSTYALRFTASGYQPAQAGGLQVTGGLTTTQNAQLVAQSTPTGTITGTVRKQGVRGVAGATVTLFAGPGAPRTATTDRRGRYQFDNLRVGAGYAVRAEKTGLQKAERTGIQVKDGQTTTVDLTLGTAGPTGGAIHGRVLDLGLQGIPAATVRLLNGPGQPVEITTDAGGNFAFDDLQPGTYSVRALAPGYADLQQDNIGVTAGGTVSLNLQLLRP